MSSFNRVGPSPLNDACYRLKTSLAIISRRKVATQAVSGDDSSSLSFTKSLEHDADGEASDPQQYVNLKVALASGTQTDFDNIVLASGVQNKLVDPQASLYTPMIGVDMSCISSLVPPTVSSNHTAAEMIELYCKELCRDSPFIDWSSDSNISTVLGVNYMNRGDILTNLPAPKVGGVINLDVLFRGNLAGIDAGPYISQLLIHDIPYGSSTLRQKYLCPKKSSVMDPVTGDPVDFGVEKTAMVNIQNGKVDNVFNISSGRFESDARFIYSGRSLAEVVHNDALFQHYYNAAQILLSLGCPKDTGLSSPSNESNFTTNGGPADLLYHVAAISGLALKHAWYHKWQIHRRLRPEAVSILLQNQKDSVPGYTYIHNNLVNSAILTDIESLHNTNYGVAGSYLLSSCYPEGSPCHPAFPAGHAVVAGACVTIMKAMLDGSTLWTDLPNLLNSTKLAHDEANSVTFSVGESTNDGTDLSGYIGSTSSMTVDSELNKLGGNISLGRDWANVHYRSDGDWGMLIGEEVAIRYLENELSAINQSPASLTLNKFDGTTITINPTLD